MNYNIHAKGKPCNSKNRLHGPGNHKCKILLAMKLTAILLAVLCFQVSANVYSQNITINEKNAPLEKVLRSIRQQSGYGFILDLKQLKNARPVSISFEKKSLEESLEMIFQ